MANKFTINKKYHSYEITKPNSTLLIYKIPYEDIRSKNIGFIIQNPFIVYILYGKSNKGKDIVYVGKSKNGIDYRPASHEDKYDNWSICYVLTQFKERTFFNDGAIQYIENELNKRIEYVGTYSNTTKSTTSGTANDSDEDDCDDYLTDAYEMLNILGLDLVSNSEEAQADADINDNANLVENRKKIPNGLYFLARKVKRLGNQEFKGTMEVKDGTFILKAQSDIAPDVMGNEDVINKARLNIKVEDGKLVEDASYASPSICGEVVIGGPCNGWTNWKDKNGRPIDIYRRAK